MYVRLWQSCLYEEEPHEQGSRGLNICMYMYVCTPHAWRLPVKSCCTYTNILIHHITVSLSHSLSLPIELSLTHTYTHKYTYKHTQVLLAQQQTLTRLMDLINRARADLVEEVGVKLTICKFHNHESKCAQDIMR